jgi:hypothetical protein
MTITVIEGKPHAYYTGVGPIPVRGRRPQDAETLDSLCAFALHTGRTTTTVPGLEVVPEVAPDIREEPRPIGFQPRRP